MYSKICETCHKSFKIKCKEQKYCSRRCMGVAFSKKTGENSSRWKDGRTLKIYKCKICGKELVKYTAKLCVFCSNKGKNNPAWGKRGNKSSNWKGGITPLSDLIRCSMKYKEWQQKVRTKYDFTCQGCKKRGGYLHVHHKKPFSILLEEIKQNLPLLDLYDGAMIYSPMWDVENGIIYCEECHKVEHKRLSGEGR